MNVASTAGALTALSLVLIAGGAQAGDKSATPLGCGFLKRGHQVMLGTRTAAKLSEWQRANQVH